MKLVLFLIAVLLVAAAVTKPDEAALRGALRDKQGLALTIAASVGELIGTARYTYHDYVIFSTLSLTSIDGSKQTVATGIFGSVLAKEPGSFGRESR